MTNDAHLLALDPNSACGEETMSRSREPRTDFSEMPPDYHIVLTGLVDLLEAARRATARAVNDVMTTTYWEVGRRIVEYEQAGSERATYGEGLLKRLATDLTGRFGRGFSLTNLKQIRKFFLLYRFLEKSQTLSDLFNTLPSREEGRTDTTEVFPKMSRQSDLSSLATRAPRFVLPWSHDVELLKVDKPAARSFYETEALRNGWTVRQLERQITTLFYERTLASKNKAAMLRKGAEPNPGEVLTPEEEIKDPLIFEFLDLKDEYSESQLEEALIQQLGTFLLELGGDFAFLGRQKRLGIGDEWYRIDLLFLPPQTPLPRHNRPKTRQVHARRRWPDAPIPDLRPRALDA